MEIFKKYKILAIFKKDFLIIMILCKKIQLFVILKSMDKIHIYHENVKNQKLMIFVTRDYF